MPNYIDELDTRASEDLRHTIQVALDNPAIRRLEKEMVIGCLNLALHEGISIGIDLCRDAFKSGDPDYGKPSN
jgi:hypothetical protein